MIFIISCASPVHNHKTEKICQEIDELTKERMFCDVETENGCTMDIIKIDQKIDKNLLECKEMREEASFSVLDFMYLLGAAVLDDDKLTCHDIADNCNN